MLNLSFSLLKFFPPETAHSITIALLKLKPSLIKYKTENNFKLNQHLWGLDFKNPVGLAAGFDKNAEVIIPLFDFGFSFIEIGTVTPKPQIGNDKPRIFRLNEDRDQLS